MGKGYSAVFDLQASIASDTGSGIYGADEKTFGFNRSAYVGLITPFGAFRFGRSNSPIIGMWVGGGFGGGRGIGEFTGGLVGAGVVKNQPEISPSWNNGFFYDVEKGGFAAGLAMTTKGSQSIIPADPSSGLNSVENEGVKGSKPAYGGYARYQFKSNMWGYRAGFAYQVDNGSSYSNTTPSSGLLYGRASQLKNAPAESKKALVVGGRIELWTSAFEYGLCHSEHRQP